MNPLVWVSKTIGQDNQPQGRGLWIWCPGCNSAHRPQCVGEAGDFPHGPCWEWNGRTDEGFSISPSLLVYNSWHKCGPEPHIEVCTDLNCERTSHMLPKEGETWERAHGMPCPLGKEGWGNCHSFITDGKWQFLSDCAHPLAGQTVPMVPLPDWLVRE